MFPTNQLHLLVVLITLFYYEFVVAGEFSPNYDEFFTVNTKDGSVRGKINYTVFDDTPYYSFRGIPYAQAPIGELRFKAPKKVKPWTETLDALDFGNDCIQPNMDTLKYFGDEDCLTLNVYVPAGSIGAQSDKQLPVVIYVVGGKFFGGTPRFYGPDFLIDQDVIVVTMNYRVGPLGFMSLNLPKYSGNMGLKDQLLAMKWVAANIDSFGGNKNNVTLFGHSSGAVSVSLHMIVPRSKRLFNRAILMSGSALNPNLPRKKDHSPILSNFAEYMHYPVNSKRELLTFLKEVDGITLSEKTYQNDYVAGYGRKLTNRIWAPVIENCDAIDPFLIKSPFDILTSDEYESHVDALYSSSPKEFVFTKEELNPSLLENFDRIFEIQLPLERARLSFRSKEYKAIKRKIRNFYFDGKHVNNDTIGALNNLMTDIVFLYSNDLTARIQAKKSSGRTYFAKFSIDNDWNLSARRSKLIDFKAEYPWHSDQLGYVFRFSGYPNLLPDTAYTNLTENSDQFQIIKNLSKFYMDFAKYGNPLPEKKPILFRSSASKSFKYFNFTNDGLVVATNPIGERIQFWNGVFNDYKKYWNTSFNFQLH